MTFGEKLKKARQNAKMSSEFIESRELAERIVEKKFQIGNYKYINCGPIKYA